MTATDVAGEGSQSSPTLESSDLVAPSSTATTTLSAQDSSSSNIVAPVTDGSGIATSETTAITKEQDEDSESVDSSYHLKWIPWNTGKIPIVMQSKNGPCPLIATMNVLLLREKVKLPNVLEQITENQLFAYLGECLMDSIPTDSATTNTDPENASPDRQNDENILLNIEQNVHDAIEILPKLRTGLDVNIRFTGITDFEYTPECIIFDLLNIPLYHGWLSEPTLIELQNAIGNQSYNQLVDNIITNKNSLDPTMQAKVLIAEEFLEGTASQLTLHGLNELKRKIKDNEIGILFRNNHFLTMFKRENEIYTLVTDHGFLTEDNIIWETLDNVEGAGRFFDANFQISNSTSTKQANQFQAETKRQQQLEMDYLLALSLREDEPEQTNINPDNMQMAVRSSSADFVSTDNLGLSSEEARQTEGLCRRAAELSLQTDYELAKRLQEEEDRLQPANEPQEESSPVHHQQDQILEQGVLGDRDLRDSQQAGSLERGQSSYSQAVQRNPNSNQTTRSNQQYHSQQEQPGNRPPPTSFPSGSNTNTSTNRRQRNEKNSNNPNCSLM